MKKIILCALMIALISCGKKKEVSFDSIDGIKYQAVITFAVGESKIDHEDGTQEKAKIGVKLSEKDKVITNKKSKVDIQFSNGEIIRLDSNSYLYLDYVYRKLGGYDTKETNNSELALISGKLFAKVNKMNKNDSFTIKTPTSIAGVRGTSFIVATSGKKDTVKVLDGAVAVKTQSVDFVIHEDQAFDLTAKNEKKVEITNSDIIEIKTLVKVDNVEKILEDKIEVEVFEKEIVEKKNQEKEKYYSEVAKENKKFDSEKEFLSFYEVREKVVLKNKKINGKVISQTGDSIIVHTVDGVTSIKKDDIVEIIYGEEK